MKLVIVINIIKMAIANNNNNVNDSSGKPILEG